MNQKEVNDVLADNVNGDLEEEVDEMLAELEQDIKKQKKEVDGMAIKPTIPDK